MRTRVGVLFACALVAAAVAAPAAALERATTIRVVSSLVSLREVDQAPKGRAGPGDSLVTVSRLRNEVRQFGKKKGVVVGSDRASLTLQRDGSVRLSGTATLPGGTIRFAGPITRTGTVVLQVVGGTGRYKNVRGTVAVTDLDDRGSALNIYRLVPGGADVA